MIFDHHRFAAFLLAGALGLLSGCGAAQSTNGASSSRTPGDAQGTSSSPTTGNGQLVVSLVDAPATAKEIHVGITKITAHSTVDGWVTVLTPDPSPLKVDLLTLQNGASLALGAVNLKPATITQVRLYVSSNSDDNYVVLADGSSDPLKIPSGVQTGIKIVGPFEIGECETTSLTLDFDGRKSIFSHPTGHGDEWILRPTILTKSSSVDFVECAPPPPAPAAPVSCGDTLPACASGDACIAGTCAGPVGSSCTLDRECISGACDAGNQCGKGGAGAPCTAGDDCLSGTCATTGLCAQSLPNNPCRVTADCESGSCGTDGVCGGTRCAPAAEGQACTSQDCCATGLDCLSNICSTTRPL